MPEGLSFFTQSSSPDWVKEYKLCALCASVVNKRFSGILHSWTRLSYQGIRIHRLARLWRVQRSRYGGQFLFGLAQGLVGTAISE
jgi:hypothetical protein